MKEEVMRTFALTLLTVSCAAAVAACGVAGSAGSGQPVSSEPAQAAPARIAVTRSTVVIAIRWLAGQGGRAGSDRALDILRE
jgi:hypothetical protein